MLIKRFYNVNIMFRFGHSMIRPNLTVMSKGAMEGKMLLWLKYNTTAILYKIIFIGYLYEQTKKFPLLQDVLFLKKFLCVHILTSQTCSWR